jgi:hypothetical protein
LYIFFLKIKNTIRIFSSYRKKKVLNKKENFFFS